MNRDSSRDGKCPKTGRWEKHTTLIRANKNYATKTQFWGRFRPTENVIMGEVTQKRIRNANQDTAFVRFVNDQAKPGAGITIASP